MPENRFKAALHEGRATVGLWSLLTDPVVVEICARSGFDWMLIDAEHTPADPRAVLTALQAAAPHPTSIVVRPPQGDAVTTKKLLDIGVQNFLVPMVETAEQADELTTFVAFPPEGIRGVSSQTRAGSWGTDPEYLHGAREEICLIVQIESMRGVENLDAILEVPGIDAVFIGPADLAATMGHLGEPRHPDVVAVLDAAAKKVIDAGKRLGTLTRNVELAKASFASGYTFVGAGTDSALLLDALRTLRSAFPDSSPPHS